MKVLLVFPSRKKRSLTEMFLYLIDNQVLSEVSPAHHVDKHPAPTRRRRVAG
jgi:hypothetical protein